MSVRRDSNGAEVPMDETRTAELVSRAQEGDAAALDQLLRAIKDDVYGLSMRILGAPADAEDATQEILTKVAVHVGSFRAESAFSTWVFRIAVRHVMRFRKSQKEGFVEFDLVEAMIRSGDGTEVPPVETVEDRLRAEEVKIGCTGAMLLSLDREHRIAWALGEVFDLASDEAAAVLEISPATYRKRLQRARDRLAGFMQRTCGLVDEAQPCRCPRQVAVNRAHGTIDFDKLLFVTHEAHEPPRRAARARLGEVTAIERAAEVLRSHPDYVAPERLIPAVRALVTDPRHAFFQD